MIQCGQKYDLHHLLVIDTLKTQVKFVVWVLHCVCNVTSVVWVLQCITHETTQEGIAEHKFEGEWDPRCFEGETGTCFRLQGECECERIPDVYLTSDMICRTATDGSSDRRISRVRS